MAKRLLSFWVLICAAILLMPSALAGNGETLPAIQIADSNFSNESCAFQLRLSGAEMRGFVFVSVCDGNSGQTKRIEQYDAAGTVPVELENVPNGDRIKAMWTDEHYMPLAHSEVSYSSALAQMLRDYRENNDIVFNDDVKPDPYAYSRLIVRSQNALPSDAPEGVPEIKRQLSDNEGHTILQFDSPADAQAYETYLRNYIPKNTADNYVTPDEPVRVPREPEGIESNLDEIMASSHSWGVSAIHADQYAADLLKRGKNRNVVVAVVDTGVDYNHTFLQGRTVPGYDYVANDKDPMDEHYHGTHVAGTVVDCTPGLTNLKIMPVRVLDAGGSGSYLNVSLGIRYAADNGADIINMSLGGGAGSCSVIDEAVDYAVSKNVIVVVAAGNESDDAKNHCPAHITKCITVAAVDSKFKPAYFTNFSSAIVDVAAPGVDIESSIPGNKYKSLNGTSMATPHVAACAAMLRDEFPNLTPAEAETKLRNTVQKPSNWDTKYGAGIVNMEATVPAEFYALLYSNGEMVFQNSKTPASGRTPLYTYAIAAVGAQYAGWYTVRDQIKTVTFADEVHPVSTALWFYGCENLTTINNPQNLKTDAVKNMSQMFARCDSLQTLDLKGMNTGNAENMRGMFFHCAALQAILASEAFGVSKVADSVDMFTGCTSLRGENGTTYSPSHTDKTYARLDKASSPGYFSGTTPPPVNRPTNPIYAVLYSDGELKFQSSPNAESGRSAVKSYTTDPGGYNDRPDNYVAWFDERGQITSVNFGVTIYPTSTALWFFGCENLTSVTNIGNLHTDDVTDMSQMFSYCSKLTSLDLSGFNTAKTTNTESMFYNCGKLATIYASGLFTTGNVKHSDSMFEGCSALRGGNGTSYSASHTDKTYARVDSGTAPGYFTAK